MTLDEFHKELSYVNASRANRLKYANLVLNDMSLFPLLVDILFMVDDKVSSRAAWVLEFVCAEYIYAIAPHLEQFSNNIGSVHFDSAVRPVAKVCVLISKTYYSKEDIVLKNLLKPMHKELIIEACFDWMISDQKIAPKVHAMETLFMFGKEYDWIHPELMQILEQDFQIQSSGFKVRAKRIMKEIKKLQI